MRLSDTANRFVAFLAGLIAASIVLTPSVFAEEQLPCNVLPPPIPEVVAEAPIVSPSSPETAIILAPEPEAVLPVAGTETLRFSEFLPDPIGDDAAEFIEIHNPGLLPVASTGWSIVDSKGKRFAIPDTTIESESYRYFMYAETKIRLTNTGGALSLEDATGATRDQASYISPVPTGKSFSSVGGIWKWTTPSPGQENSDDAPVPEVVQPAPIVPTPIAVIQPPADSSTISPEIPNASFEIGFSALFPNPDGDDTYEWIEIKNVGTAEISLDGWKISDLANVTFSLTGKLIASGATLRIPKSESRISLNNTGEEVRLIAPDGVVRETVRYDTAPSGATFEKNAAGEWKWYGSNGALIAAISSASGGGLTIAESADVIEEPSVNLAQKVSDLSALSDGDSAIVQAVVTMVPGMFGKTTFAVRDADEESGVIVRMYGKGPFPTLRKGDVVKIVAHLKKGETIRLSTTAKGVSVISAGRLPVAANRSPSEISSEDEGLEVAVHGLVTGRGKRWVSLSDDTASTEITGRLVSGETPAANEGDEITVTGVVRMVSGKPELAVSESSSFHIVTPPTVSIVEPQEDKTKVESVSGGQIAMNFPARADESPLSAWGTAGAITLTVVLGYALWRRKGGVPDEASGL